MKRDMEFIRELLLKVEEEESRFDYVATDSKTEHHLDLLIEVGWITAKKYHYIDNTITFDITGLTWDGHEFLNAARDDKVWEKAEEKAQSNGMDLSSLPLEVTKDLLIAIVKNFIGLS